MVNVKKESDKKQLFKIKDGRENEYLDILKNIKKVKVAVIGDIVADEYIYGNCERISREAPVLILRHHNSKITPGGAGNASANVAALGAQVYSVGILGKDSAADAVIKFYKENGIKIDGIQRSERYETCVKTRIMSGSLHTTLQQVIRIDSGGEIEISKKDADLLLKKIAAIVPKVDSILLSDYNCGLFTEYFTLKLQNILKKEYSKRKIFVLVDSRHRLFDFKNAYLATPNESEAFEATGIRIKDTKSLVKSLKKLIELTENKAMLITRGSQGMAFLDESGGLHEIAITRVDEIADVTGAGDTVAAVLASSLPVAKKPEIAVELANIGGGAKVMKRGTAQVSADELIKEISRINK